MAISELTRSRLRQSHLGQRPWNKGIKGPASHCFGRKLSNEARKKLSLTHSGPRSHFWKGGKSGLMPRLKASTRYIEWRRAIFARDNYTCRFCHRRGGTLHADHIKPKALILDEHKITTVVAAMRCVALWDLNNGRTLCAPCHRNTDSYGGKYKRNYKHKMTDTFGKK